LIPFLFFLPFPKVTLLVLDDFAIY